MKKMKKLLAMLLAMTMVFGMSLTTFAADDTFDVSGDPKNTDHVKVTVEGLETGSFQTSDGTTVAKSVSVTLYQIAQAQYGGEKNDTGFIDYVWNANIPEVNAGDKVVLEEGAATLSTEHIIKIANALSGTETNKQGETATNVTTGSCSFDVKAGIYVAIISNSTGGYVYNPVLLTATYSKTKDGSTQLIGGSINVSDAHYLNGSSAVAKRTEPKVEKEIKEGTTPDTKGNDPIHTAAVGDVLTYTVTPTMPEYPSNATNKLFFISDTMTHGLTFDYSSLNVTIDGVSVTKVGDQFKMGEKVIATAVSTPAGETATGFNLNFNYDNLIYGENGAVYTPVVSYKAVINDTAVVGGDGNKNNVELYYSKEPNSGNTWTPNTPGEKPTPGNGIEKKEDVEVVYTYQLALEKVDEKDTTVKLPGAVFGIYDSNDKLVDMIKTNDQGIAVSTKVKAGTYTVKELIAPEGYTLDPTPKSVTVNWSFATVTTTSTSRTWQTYASAEDVPEDAEQIGWELNGVFYALDEYAEADLATVNGLKKAYLVATSVTSNSETTLAESAAGAGTVSVGQISNTKLVALPSTGGIGTTIFTIGGCALMILAAALYFATRRKTAK